MSKFLRNLFAKSIKARYLIFFICGLLFPLSFPPFNVFILFFFILIFITLFIRVLSSYKSLFIAQFCFTAGVSITGLYWVVYAINYAVENPILNFIGFIGFIVVYSSIFMPAFFLLFLYRKDPINFKFTTVAVVAWSASEIMKNYFLGGFPWFLASQIWVFSDYMLQITNIIGNLWFSILTIMFVFSFLILFDNVKKIKLKLCFIGIFAFIFIFIGIYGYNKIVFNKVKEKELAIEVPVRMVKTNISQKEKLDYRYNLLIFNNTIKVAFKNLDYNNPPRYIILPEVAFNFVLEDYPELFLELKNKIPSKSILLLGALRRDGNNFYNSFYAISGESKEVVYTYDKVKLVPFGEYIPFVSNFPRLEELLGLFSLKQGNHYDYFTDIVEVNGISIEVGILPLICFEGLFLFSVQNNSSYQLAINLSNEAWFNESIELEQNNSIVKLRVIESGISTLKVANSGLSSLFDNHGGIVYQNKISNVDVFDTKVAIYKNNNFSKKLIVSIAVMLVLIIYFILILRQMGKIKNSGSRKYKK